MEKNKSYKKKKDRLFLSKVFIVGLLIILQSIFLAYVIFRMGKYYAIIQAVCTVISLVVVLYIINKPDHPAYKLAWVVPILLFPIFGGVFYLVIAGNQSSKGFVKRMGKSITVSQQYLPEDEQLIQQLEASSRVAAMQSRYISSYGGYPVYAAGNLTYYKLGDDAFEPMLEALRQAERYIFLEYFIIREGIFWDSMLEILENKVKEGVDVRLIFDDMGCVATIPSDYERRLIDKGIKVYSFNRFIPVLTLRLNNRDHRKILVVDGKVGFTGGINLGDEYINATSPYGHWKDNAICVEGESVWSLTVMFLQMWEYVSGEKEDYLSYKPNEFSSDTQIELEQRDEAKGYIQPYSDSPLDNEIVGENIYLNMINRAQRRVYIMTPYLILDSDMITALSLAAKSGVDVRIILPGIPDKRSVYEMTQTNSQALLNKGIKIYTYTPGFVHAKVVLVDDEYATIGTVNFDYRSLYLHFECGIWMYRCPVIADIEADFQETFTHCEEMLFESPKGIGHVRKLFRAVLKMFEPLL